MPAHRERLAAFPDDYLIALQEAIRRSPLFTVNNLNRDFVGTRGFSIVFHRSALPRVHAAFPVFRPFLDAVLQPHCNAFYLNPLQLAAGSRVDPHIDRSLRAYSLDVDPPLVVSVLYIAVPPAMVGGDLVLRRSRKFLGRIRPAAGLLIDFDGDLTHSVERVDSPGERLSLVCEQYQLEADELAEVPEYAVESRARTY